MLQRSPDEIRAMAAVTSVLGIPSDMTFAAAHWRLLSREEAEHRNPFYVNRLPAEVFFYSCDRVGADGKCQAYEDRPLVCRGYPWYDQPVRNLPLPHPECGYQIDIQAACGGCATGRKNLPPAGDPEAGADRAG
ncbi:hypothetical protein L6Q96_00880 [Candidatus Binatia bacterium]|nr:hypothetical protein [Candidatus Binatia bacterium]